MLSNGVARLDGLRIIFFVFIATTSLSSPRLAYSADNPKPVLPLNAPVKLDYESTASSELKLREMFLIASIIIGPPLVIGVAIGYAGSEFADHLFLKTSTGIVGASIVGLGSFATGGLIGLVVPYYKFKAVLANVDNARGKWRQLSLPSKCMKLLGSLFRRNKK